MRVVSIFGGTGFIGTELIHELEKKNYEIRLFTRRKIPHTLNTYQNKIYSIKRRYKIK